MRNVERFKAFRFQSFILFTDEISDNELKEIMNGSKSYIKSFSKGFRQENENFYLDEWVQYYVTGIVGSELTKEDYFYSGQYNRNNSGILCFNNFIGTARFREQIFNIESSKIKTTDFNRMISNIDERIKDIVSLVFKSNSVAKGIYSKTGFREYDYYVYLRIYQLMKEDKIIPFSRYIRKHHNFRFVRNVETKSINLIKDVSPDSIVDVMSGKNVFAKISDSRNSVFGENILFEMNEYQVINSVDTVENQFVKFFLNYLIRLLNHFRNSLLNSLTKGEGVVNVSLIEEVTKMQEELILELSHPFFNRISKMNTMNSSSTVLTRKFGYKELFKSYLSLNQEPVSVFDSDSLIELLQNKSVDKLYEYICLFRLIDIISEIYGEKNVVSGKIDTKETSMFSVGISEGGGVEFVFDKTDKFPKTTLMFQHRFSRNNSKYLSVSVDFRPDFTIILEDEKSKQYYHFDSKFRIGNNNDSKNDDIAKMHSYRDAILYTAGAYVLYPGDKTRTYGRPESYYYEGVGAFPLNFNREHDSDLEKMINSVLKNFKKNS